MLLYALTVLQILRQLSKAHATALRKKKKEKKKYDENKTNLDGTYCISGMTGETQLKFGNGDIPPLHNEIC